MALAMAMALALALAMALAMAMAMAMALALAMAMALALALTMTPYHKLDKLMTKRHWENYKEYAKSLSIGTLQNKQKDISFKLENEPHKLFDRGKTELELEIITDVILQQTKSVSK